MKTEIGAEIDNSFKMQILTSQETKLKPHIGLARVATTGGG